MIIEREFNFDSAHFLPLVPLGHKCKTLHGHTYRITVRVSGELDEKGWVLDFADIKDVVQPVINLMDHKLLNMIEGLENPTAEKIAEFLFYKIKPNLPLLDSIVVQEGLNSRVEFRA